MTQTVLDFIKTINTKEKNLEQVYTCECGHQMMYKTFIRQFRSNMLFYCIKCNQICILNDLYMLCIDYCQYWIQNNYDKVTLNLFKWLDSIANAKNAREIKLIKYNKEIEYLHSEHKLISDKIINFLKKLELVHSGLFIKQSKF